MKATEIVSAPARICLFGEHQDYLGLAVIAAAIDLRLYVRGTPRADGWFRVDMPDIGQSDAFQPDSELPYRGPRDYLRAVVNVLLRHGVRFPQGYDCQIRSTIPINAGVSSSSALVVAWTRFLLAVGEPAQELEPAKVARLAHEAEVLEFGEPGGMMDHYTCSLGGLLYIDCGKPLRVRPLLDDEPDALPARLAGLVLGCSLEEKDTTSLLARVKAAAQEGIRALQDRWPAFDLRSTPLSEAEPHLAALPPDLACVLRANIVNRDLCRQALALFQGKAWSPQALGRLLDAHHAQLRDGLGVSTPKLEALIEAARSAGALGCKLVGSGGGGCMVAYAPGHEAEVARAIESAGGRAFKIGVDGGVRVEPRWPAFFEG